MDTLTNGTNGRMETAMGKQGCMHMEEKSQSDKEYKGNYKDYTSDKTLDMKAKTKPLP